MKKITLLVALLVVGIATVNAQSPSKVKEQAKELKAQQAEKQSKINKLQGEVNALQAQIDKLPGWRIGAFGTIGANLSGFDNWYSKEYINSSAGNIGFTVNALANLIQDKYFWRNAANANLAWLKNDNLDDAIDSDFEASTDVFNLTSLFGYNLSKNLAASTLAEYRTSLLNNFNDPGYLDLGVGATWTPLENLVIVVNPANYNFVFSKGSSAYESSLGTKILIDYTRKFLDKINFKTNLSAFQSYKSNDLSNWTWINSFGYTLWKGIGLGFEFGLRQNKQEVFNNAFGKYTTLVEDAKKNGTTLPATTIVPELGKTDNVLQSYWLAGLNYSF